MSIQEIVKYATSTPHNTNPNVLKTMLEEEMTGGDFDKALAPIIEAIESVGGTVESETVEGVVEALNIAFDPWERLPNEGVDSIGAYTTTSDNYTENIRNNGVYLRLKKGYEKNSGWRVPQIISGGIDLTNLSEVHTVDNAGSTVLPIINQNTGISRIIMPEKYPYFLYQGQSKRCVVISSTPVVAIYLSKECETQDYPSVSWMGSPNSLYSKQIVKCPKDTSIPYYLNKFSKMSGENIVEIFENLIDNSNGDTTLTLTLGTDNLAKLTEEQKNIAYAKGWNLA